MYAPCTAKNLFTHNKTLFTERMGHNLTNDPNQTTQIFFETGFQHNIPLDLDVK